ncbi:MAG: hypothetical protein GKR87_06365 [Kiritimatiellae bacterium]|nr:hypothetical protein [Kiritimatiellia bacterium]
MNNHLKIRFCITLIIFCFSLFVGSSGAQDVSSGQTRIERVQQNMTLKQVIETGGFLMIVLAFMSVVALAFVFYFLVVLREGHIMPRRFVQDLREKLDHDQLDEAQDACHQNRSSVSAVVSSALAYAQRVDEPAPELLKEMIEGEGNRQAVMIQNQTQYLLDIAVISPMVGLLGTVMGMLQAFNTVALDLAKAKPMLLAAGVSQALITTAAGLIVGIPAMMFYAYFRGKSSKLLSQLEMVSADFLTLLVQKRKP